MSSQRRIQFDEFSRKVATCQNFSDYQNTLFQIQRNSSSRHLNQRLKNEQGELEMEEHLRKIQEDNERKCQQMRLEREIAEIQAAKSRQDYHEKKMRQQVRENNQELRELESRLRTAYVSKAIAAQKKERDVLKIAEKIQEKEEKEILEKERLAHLEQLKRDQENERLKKMKLREELTNQIISAHQQHQLLYEQFLKEKAYLDEIVKLVQQEIMEEVEKKIRAKERTKKEMEAFQIAKREIENMRQIEVQEENERIKKYCEERDRKIEEEERRRRELELKRDTLNEKMVKELSELIDKKNERERLLQELWAFEQNEKIEEKLRSQMEYQLRLRIESRVALEQQLLDRQRRREREEKDEKIFCEKQLQMLAERDKIEQLSNERRRKKIAEHRKAIQEMLDERRRQQELELAEEIKLRDIEKQEEKRKQEIIEEERIKILQEHAQALIGFLPSDILRETDKANFSAAAAASNRMKAMNCT